MGFRFYGAATSKDWQEAFGKVADGMDIHFFQEGFHDSHEIIAQSLESIKDIDVSHTGILVQQPFYCCLPSSQPLEVCLIHMNDGNARYVIDWYGNPGNVVFRPGGVYQDKYFVISEMSSVWKNGGAVDVAKRVVRYAQRHWHRGNTFWIGPDCYARYAGTHTFTEDYRYPQAGSTVNEHA